MYLSVIFFSASAIFAFTSAVPLLVVEDEQGQQYKLTPILVRDKRQTTNFFNTGPVKPQPQWYSSGAGNSQSQHGTVGFNYPNGSGGKLGYAHANGYGHDVSVDAMVPVWSKKNRHSESTLTVGGGVTQHFGGFPGNQLTDKRVGIGFTHRF